MSSNSDFFAGGGSLVPRLVAVEQQVSQFFAGEVAKEVSFPTWYTPPSIYVEKNGAVLSKAAYPALWAAVSSSAITSAAYDAVVAASPIGACSQYADIDASTFKVPTVGQGGFSKAVGSNGFDIGNEDGGFGSQMSKHKHATAFNHTSAGDFNIVLPDDYVNNGAGGGPIFGSANIGATSNTAYVLGNGTTTPGAFPYSVLTNDLLHQVSGETSPQGFYNRIWIYTGNIVSNLPEPEPDWLAQQALNTAAITEILNVPYAYARGDSHGTVITGPLVLSPNRVEELNGITLNNGNYTVPKAGVYEMSWNGIDGASNNFTSVRIMLSKNRPNSVPSTGDINSYFAQSYIDDDDSATNPYSGGPAVSGLVRCNAGDTIQAWLVSGDIYTGGINSDLFCNTTVKFIGV